MVKLATLVLLALTHVAAAERVSDDDYEDPEEVEPNPAFNMFGFQFTAGALPIHGRTGVLSLGLGIEHPVFKKTRVFGEYEWLWLTQTDERDYYGMSPRPERRGNGHRTSLGLRRELVGKRTSRAMRIFIDGELGANVALVDDNMTGVSFRPGALFGLRLGYDIYTGSDESPSRTFEIEMVMRAIAIQGGAGALIGLGMFWGN
jgi:hypothetical protein